MAGTFRADQVGSLLRPPELLKAREEFTSGQITRDQLREVEDACVLRALDMQKQTGISVYTGGEYRRSGWASIIRESVEGLVQTEGPANPRLLRPWQGPHAALANSSIAVRGGILQTGLVAGRIRQVRRLVEDEAAFLREHAPGPWKITMPGAISAAGQLWKPGVTDQYYASKREFIDEIAAMLQREIRALVEDGVSYIQLDSLHYVERIADPIVRQQMIEDGEDPDRYLDELIEVDNSVLNVAKEYPNVTVGMHMCRGNNRSAWHAEGSYEPIAEKAFNLLNVDRFLLEYDTERAGGFEPLRFMPKNKMVVLGLISSKEPQLESIDDLRRRIDEAAKYVPFENLAISPQCGFASTALGNLLTWDDQRRKLELVAETARRVWG
ncbi:MAG TPA: cobalamin-independent methionine synthase II family protein [Dehalococcoidia bacterium]|nr:cobalamin-independent methionine synthase II family protein [Dehalococcoidia bacterium]